MKSFRKEIRARYTEVWFLYNLYSSAMAHESKSPKISGSTGFDEEQNAIDEYMETTGASVPPVSELISQIDKLETSKLPDDQLESEVEQGKQEEQSELEQLLEQENAESSKVQIAKSSPRRPFVQRKKPVQVVEEQDDDDEDYPESFASQQETAQLREDFDTITHRFEALEAQFELVMKERQNLPDVINNIRADLNTQLTTFSDKLYSILESQASKQEIQSALATIEEVRSDHSEQLKAASGYLSSDPKPTSPIVSKGISLKGKGKFKPVK